MPAHYAHSCRAVTSPRLVMTFTTFMARSATMRCCLNGRAAGNDWTPVRALNSYIKGTNGKSQGVVPFLKVANDTAVAVNQGGKRKGAVCAYLETWHLDIEEFLELRKNTGDDRRRTHDMNTANWVPDLFMQRVFEDAEWTLFTPSEVPDLHDLTGEAFAERYAHYEAIAKEQELLHKKSVRKTCGVKCCRCCLKQAIRGLHLKMYVTYVRHNNTQAWFTRQTCVQKLRSTPAKMKLQYVT